MADIVSDVLDWAVALLLTFFMLIIFALLIGSFKDRDVDTSAIDPIVYLAKVHYSPHILYEIDPYTKQPITGLVSRERLASLDKNNQYDNPYIGAKLTLMDEKSVIIGTYYNNEAFYNRAESFAKNDVRGPGGATYENYTLPVAYREGNIKRGYLLIEVVRANSARSDYE